jgi:hypothetical protein
MSDRIFISSVEKELAVERQAVRDFVRGDALLSRFTAPPGAIQRIKLAERGLTLINVPRTLSVGMSLYSQ